MVESTKLWRFIMTDDEGYGEEGYTVIGMDHYTSEERHPYGRNILLFFLGGLVGAGVTLLLAPQSGKKIRQKISEASRDARTMAGSYYTQARERVETAAERGKEFVGEAKPFLDAAIEAGKAAYERDRQNKMSQPEKK
jgi:gas vesicle protein